MKIGKYKTGQFFNAIFENKPDDQKIVTFSLPDKKVKYHDSFSQNDYDHFHKSTKNEYFGLGTVKKTLPGNKRPSVNDIDGIGCFWLDVDMKSPYHKSSEAPETVIECLDLVDSLFELKPNLIVDSGHGIHAYWVFDEYYEFFDDNDRQKAIQYSREFQQTYRNIAQVNHGWKIDSTHDLSRVLRIPNSHNYKNKENPKLVEIIRLVDERISLNELLDVIDLPESIPAKAGKKDSPKTSYGTMDNFHISQDMEPPVNAFMALCENEKKFKLSWENKRNPKDLIDQSPSSYDYSLVNYALMANWNTQDIIALLVAHRRKHNHDLKINRLEDYYLRTINNVQRDIESDQNDLDEIALSTNPDTGFQYISDKLGIDVIEVEKHGERDGAIYYLTVNGYDKIRVGCVEYFTSQSKFANKIFEAIGKFPKQQKTNQWRKIMETMSQVMSIIEYDDLEGDTIVLVPLSKYLNELLRVDVYGEDVIGIIAMNSPYVDNEKNEACINLNHFLDYLKSDRISLNRAEVCSRLKGIGFKERIIRFTLTDNQKKDYNLKGKQLQKRYWTVNKGVYDEKTLYL